MPARAMASLSGPQQTSMKSKVSMRTLSFPALAQAGVRRRRDGASPSRPRTPRQEAHLELSAPREPSLSAAAPRPLRRLKHLGPWGGEEGGREKLRENTLRQ